MKALIFLLAAVASTCSTAQERLTPLAMQDGTRVNNCIDYNTVRQRTRVRESVRNMAIASEYLECAYLLSGAKPENNAEITQKIYNSLTVKDIPLSISNAFEHAPTLEEAGFKADFKGGRVTYDVPPTYIAISLEREFDDGGHLIFVSDEVLNATYRAYFALKIKQTDKGLKVLPVYPSGF